MIWTLLKWFQINKVSLWIINVPDHKHCWSLDVMLFNIVENIRLLAPWGLLPLLNDHCKAPRGSFVTCLLIDILALKRNFFKRLWILVKTTESLRYWKLWGAFVWQSNCSCLHFSGLLCSRWKKKRRVSKNKNEEKGYFSLQLLMTQSINIIRIFLDGIHALKFLYINCWLKYHAIYPVIFYHRRGRKVAPCPTFKRP